MDGPVRPVTAVPLLCKEAVQIEFRMYCFRPSGQSTILLRQGEPRVHGLWRLLRHLEITITACKVCLKSTAY